MHKALERVLVRKFKFKSVESKYDSNHGFDGPYIKREATGKLEQIVLAESKASSKDSVHGLSKNSQGFEQLSKDYIKQIFRKLSDNKKIKDFDDEIMKFVNSDSLWGNVKRLLAKTNGEGWTQWYEVVDGAITSKVLVKAISDEFKIIQGASNTLTLKRLVAAGMIASVPPTSIGMRLELSFDLTVPTDDEFAAICFFNENNLSEDDFKMSKFSHVSKLKEDAKNGSLIADIGTVANGILVKKPENDSMLFLMSSSNNNLPPALLERFGIRPKPPIIPYSLPETDAKFFRRHEPQPDFDLEALVHRATQAMFSSHIEKWQESTSKNELSLSQQLEAESVRMKLKYEASYQQIIDKAISDLNQVFVPQSAPTYMPITNNVFAGQSMLTTAPRASLKIVVGSGANHGAMSCTRDSGGHVACQNSSASKFKG